jgi:hypothetical protein
LLAALVAGFVVALLLAFAAGFVALGVAFAAALLLTFWLGVVRVRLGLLVAID